MTTEYSGRTTSYNHKSENWQQQDGTREPALKQMTVFDVQWSDCPIEVAKEVSRMWKKYELRNDNCIVKWTSEDHGEDYPIIDKYLKSKGVTECWINWWW